jgi:hypothetical protein
MPLPVVAAVDGAGQCRTNQIMTTATLGLFPSGSANRYCYSFQAPRQPVWLRGLKLRPIPLAGNEITLPVAAAAGLPLCIAPLHIALPSRGASWDSGSHSPL